MYSASLVVFRKTQTYVTRWDTQSLMAEGKTVSLAFDEAFRLVGGYPPLAIRGSCETTTERAATCKTNQT